MKTANFGELENMNVSSDDYHVGFALKKFMEPWFYLL